MTPLLPALALFAQSPADLSGLYRTHQMEVGAALELNSDGTFRYSLDYGAVSEAAEGHWTKDQDGIHLDSDPMPLDLLSEIERRDAAFKDEVLKVEDGALVLPRYETVFTFYREEE